MDHSLRSPDSAGGELAGGGGGEERAALEMEFENPL